VLDKNGQILYSPEPVMHFANTISALKEVWDEIAAGWKCNHNKYSLYRQRSRVVSGGY